MILLELFLGFLEVGLFSFGGAYGAIALIREVVLAHGWMSEDMLSYVIAVSESTPGPIMVNLATYVGSTQAGAPGAIVATLAVILPSFWIILLLMVLWKRYLENPWVKAILSGLKAPIIGIIAATGLEFAVRNCIPQGRPDWLALGLTLALAVLWFGFRPRMRQKPTPIALIGIAAVLGVVIYSF